MKFTLSWLKDHLETDTPVEAVAERLTMIGLEVDAVVDRAGGLEDFVVAHVVAAEPHPKTDKLKVCVVDTGARHVQVVCGAPNARAGMKGVFADVGAFVPGTGMALKRAVIRGVESAGMLLSEREMGLSDDHSGIVELADDAPVGARAVDVMGLADPLIDVAVTPNRADCLGVRGIARDLAAAGLGTLRPLAVDPVPGSLASPIGVRLDFDPPAADACPYFVGRYVRGVRNAESPAWLKARLLSVGLRPISALVDITNYLTLDLCRPLHVFDADKVRGDLHVRLARPGERLPALNDRAYELDSEMTVIADDHGPEALGGVIGGDRTGCTDATVNVFLESAFFDPVRTASTGRKLNLLSDARYRFERGIDPTFLVPGMEIATRLILDLCGGEASDPVIAGAEPSWQRTIPLQRDRVQRLAGVEVSEADTTHILSDLGFDVEPGENALSVTVPSWRGDIVGEACLVEEVVRIFGYDRIRPQPLARESDLPAPAVTPAQRRRARIRRTLAARGLMEAVTYSFVSSAAAAAFATPPPSLRLVNPISAELDVMRPSILPNLIVACGRNADRGTPNGALFEIGPQYTGDRPEEQAMVAAGVRAGQTGPRHWAQPPRAVDAFDAKADALACLDTAGVDLGALTVTTDAPHWYHPGRSGTLRLGPKAALAHFGEIHPGVLRRLDVAGPMVGFEVYLDTVPERRARRETARPPLALSPLQPVERDFAFVLDAEVAADSVVRAAAGADPLIEGVRIFDVFTGEALGPGKKSLAITVILQPREQTLTDADLDALARRVIDRVASASGGVLRA